MDKNIDPQYQEFIIDLQKQPKTKTRDVIEKRAVRYMYHDFGPSDFPKLLLLANLRQAGYSDMLKKAADGDYDF